MRNHLLGLVLLLILFSSFPAVFCYGEIDKVAVVSWVWDGDTFDTEGNERIRLADIDTPEEEDDLEAYWEAKNYMIDKISDETVYLDVDDKYTYDDEGQGTRLVCVVYLDYNQTHYLNVNKALLENGLAVIWEHDNEFNSYTWTLFVYKTTIPEFPSWFLIALFVTAIVAVIIYKKRS